MARRQTYRAGDVTNALNTTGSADEAEAEEAAEEEVEEEIEEAEEEAYEEGAEDEAAAEAKPKAGKPSARMLKAIGIKADDVAAYNDESKTLVSHQGGKYRMKEDGKTLIWLMGPKPKELEEAEAAGKA